METVQLRTIEITPQEITFSSDSPITDTVITIGISVQAEAPAGSTLIYSVINKRESITSGELRNQNGTEFFSDISLAVHTADNINFKVFVYSGQGLSSESLETNLSVRGRQLNPPLLVDAFNTDSVIIPEGDNRERIDFFAEVTHPDGQNFIERVMFFIIDEDGNQLGNTEFELFDDGVFNEQEGRIDEEENDNIYSRALFINSSNSPDRTEVFYYALGTDGQSSDTLQTTLKIVN